MSVFIVSSFSWSSFLSRLFELNLPTVPHNEKEWSEISLSTYLYNGVVVDVAQVDTTGTEWLSTCLVVYDSDTEIVRLAADTEAEEDNLDGWKEELKDEKPTRET